MCECGNRAVCSVLGDRPEGTSRPVVLANGQIRFDLSRETTYRVAEALLANGHNGFADYFFRGLQARTEVTG